MVNYSYVLDGEEAKNTQKLFKFLEKHDGWFSLADLVPLTNLDVIFIKRSVGYHFFNCVERRNRKTKVIRKEFKFVRYPTKEELIAAYKETSAKKICTSCRRFRVMSLRADCCDDCTNAFIPKPKMRLAKCGHYSRTEYFTCKSCQLYQSVDVNDMEEYSISTERYAR